jgi:hypothetical protein
MNIEHWNWAVWTLVVLNVVWLCTTIGWHGKPKTGEYNAGVGIFSFLLIAVLYWQAGFLK